MNTLDQFRLDGRVAIVTGASSGIGLHFAEVLASAGADLVLGARRRDMLESACEMVKSLGRRCIAIQTDVTSLAACQTLVSAALDEFGDIHVLVNNAGVGHAAPAHREDPAEFQQIVATNLLGAYYMSWAFGRVCIERGHGGSIVNVASVLAIRGGDLPQAAYSSSKAGMLGMTRDLAMQWSGRYGIRVNALAPSYFDTPLTRDIVHDGAALQKILDRTPLGRIGRETELDGPLLLLTSEAGSYITGVTLPVDGGWSLH